MIGRTTKTFDKDGRLIMSRIATVEQQGDRSFDIEFWQQLSDEERMQAVWDMVVFDWEIKGKDINELRLQRTVESICESGR